MQREKKKYAVMKTKDGRMDIKAKENKKKKNTAGWQWRGRRNIPYQNMTREKKKNAVVKNKRRTNGYKKKKKKAAVNKGGHSKLKRGKRKEEICSRENKKRTNKHKSKRRTFHTRT